MAARRAVAHVRQCSLHLHWNVKNTNQVETAANIAAPAILIALSNRFRNSSNVRIAAHNRRVGQRKGVCGKTKKANKNVEAKRSRTATIKSSRARGPSRNAATASSTAPLR